MLSQNPGLYLVTLFGMNLDMKAGKNISKKSEFKIFSEEQLHISRDTCHILMESMLRRLQTAIED